VGRRLGIDASIHRLRTRTSDRGYGHLPVASDKAGGMVDGGRVACGGNAV
jgi:hypothetical protein